jgi:NADH-quinone oxidoreductase subunit G
MPVVTIDDQQIDVPQGTTIIEAAAKLGIYIPRYCYHPGLRIVGSCRMCLVEVENAPKLLIACYTFVQDGMVVHTTTEKVIIARQAILEFLLANHPLDCPVCDQAGECKLQEFYMDFGRYDSTLLENKHKKHKAIPIGPHIILDSERCILCSRCTRFCDDVTKTHELGIFERGAHSELLPVKGREVDNPYSGCLADICPVGALTDRDFRFKVRVWYLDSTESVCHGCARGCNIRIDTNRRRTHHNDGKLIARYKPRFNGEVNGHWMCDTGRYSYKTIEVPERVLHPGVRLAGDQPERAEWTMALSQIDERVSQAVGQHGIASTAVIAIPSLSNEELWAVRKLFSDGMRVENIAFRCPPDPSGVEDDLLRKADTFPNSFGAEAILGTLGGETEVARVLDGAASGRFKTLIIIGGGLVTRLGEDVLREKLRTVELVVAIQTHRSAITEAATVIAPMTTYTETDGTVCNFEGRVQRYWAAIPPVAHSRPLLDILADLAQRWELKVPPREADLCFEELSRHVAHFDALTYDDLGETGVNPASRQPVGAAEPDTPDRLL